MNVSEATLVAWSKGPSKTESDRCDHSETAIRKAIRADHRLAGLDVSVFAQGSYKARTNIGRNSDVDICVRYNNEFFADYPSGTTDATFGNRPGTMPFVEFKGMVHQALSNHFGTAAVTRGNKALKLRANSYRIEADVVPTFEHRRYEVGSDRTHSYLSGVGFRTDAGELIENWPQQNYDNGVHRNNRTGRKYKRVIRILKHLRAKMGESGTNSATPVPSFLIEGLVWNSDLRAFEKSSYTEVLRYVIADTWNNTRNDESCAEWGEVNELKYLFRNSQPWTRYDANSFLQEAWNYLGYQ